MKPFDFAQDERARPVRFAGYAAVFDRPDKGGDIVRKGAFLRALERASEVPLLWQHCPRAVIGRIEHLSEDARALELAWTRRSREGFAWTDEVDAPLGEALELYRVTIAGQLGAGEYHASEPALRIPAGELAAIGMGPAQVEVCQIGDAAVSRPARCSVTIQTGAV